MKVRLSCLIRCFLPTLFLFYLLLLTSVSLAYFTYFSRFSAAYTETSLTSAAVADRFCPPPHTLAKQKIQPPQKVCLLENNIQVKKTPAECLGERRFQFECQWTRYWQLYTNHQLVYKYENVEVLVQPFRNMTYEGVPISYNDYPFSYFCPYSYLIFPKIERAPPETKHDKHKNYKLLKTLDDHAKKNKHIILDLHTTNVVLTPLGEIRIIDMNVYPSRWFWWNVGLGIGTVDTKLKGMDNLYGYKEISEDYS